MILATKTEFLVGYTVRDLLPARHDCFIVRVWNPKTGASRAEMPGERDGRNFKITSDHEFLACQWYHIEITGLLLARVSVQNLCWCLESERRKQALLLEFIKLF